MSVSENRVNTFSDDRGGADRNIDGELDQDKITYDLSLIHRRRRRGRPTYAELYNYSSDVKNDHTTTNAIHMHTHTHGGGGGGGGSGSGGVAGGTGSGTGASSGPDILNPFSSSYGSNHTESAAAVTAAANARISSMGSLGSSRLQGFDPMGHHEHESLDPKTLLLREREKLDFFQTSLQQCNKLTEHMNTVLDGLELKLKTLHTTLRPLQKATKDVATAESNIKKAIEELNKVVKYNKVATEPMEKVQQRRLQFSSQKKYKKAKEAVSEEKGENAEEKITMEEEETKLEDNEKESGKEKKEKENKEEEEDEEAYEDSNLDMKDDPFLEWVLQLNDARHYLARTQFRSSGQTMQSLEEIAQVALDKMRQYFKELLEQQRSQSVRSIEKVIELNMPLDWYNRDLKMPLWSYQVTGNVRKQQLELINPFLTKHPVFDAREITAIPRDFPIYMPWSMIRLLSNISYSIEDTCDCFKPLFENPVYPLLVESRQDLLSTLLSPTTGLANEVVLCIQYFMAQRRLRAAEEQQKKEEANNLQPTPQNNTDRGLTMENLQSQLKKDGKEEKKKDVEDDDDDVDTEILSREDDGVGKFFREGAMALNGKLNTSLDRLQLSVEILHHPIIPFLVLSLTFMQMERHLCEKILRKSENKSAVGLLLSAICEPSLQHIAARIDQVLRIEDSLSFSRQTILRYNVKQAGSSQYDAIVAACANIANNSGNSIATNGVLIKLDLVRTWHVLTPSFEQVFEFTGKKWEDLDELLGETSKKKKVNKRIPPMVYIRQLRKRIDMEALRTIDFRIQKIVEHRENKPRPDGGYHPLTIETVDLICNMHIFRNTVEELYQSWNEEVRKVNHHDNEFRLDGPMYKYEIPVFKVLLNSKSSNTSGIQDVMSETMKALQTNLQEKSKQYGNAKVLRLIFLLNNYHYIVKCIGDTPLEEACGKGEIENLRKEIGEMKKKYLKESWGKIESCLDIEHDSSAKKTTNLKRRERDAVKKRFNSFNEEFVAQHALQTKYTVPDSSLRADLQERNKKFIGSKYAEVWRRYENVDFTTNKSKYFIYPPKQLETMLDQFFEPN